MLLRALLAVVVLVSGCSADEPAPEPPQSWSVELGTAPTLLALTDDDVLAASYGNGVGGSQVYRVDRATGRLVAQRTLAGQPNGLALGPDGALWLATLQLPDQPTGTGLQVLDPQTLTTRRALDVGDAPLSVAFVDDELWVGIGSAVHQVDPATGRSLRSVPTAVRPYRLLALGPGLLVVGPEGLQRVDTVSGTASAARPVQAGGSVSAYGDEQRLWVVHPDDRDRSVLQRYDAQTLQAAPAAVSPGRAGAAAWLGPDVLWVSDPGGGRLLCADPTTGAVRAERPVALTGPLVADGRSVVVAQSDGLAALPATC